MTASNDYCPCGSGKKYKKCCMLQDEPAKQLTKEILDQACQKAIGLLLDFYAACADSPRKPPLKRSLPQLPDKAARNMLIGQLLMPWTVYLWCPAGSETEPLPSERTTAAQLLREKGEGLDGMTRKYIEAARREPFSYWEVQSVLRGAKLYLKDMITGEERVVLDVSLSKACAKWDILFAQVVGFDGTFIVNAMGLYPLYPERFRQAVDEFVGGVKAAHGVSPARTALLARQADFVEHYLSCIDQAAHFRPPELVNMDGDKLVFTESQYAFQPQHRATVLAALGSMAEIEQAEQKKDEVLFDWLAEPRKNITEGPVRKGSIKVGADNVETDCNSEKRDKALRKRLLAQCRDILTHKSTTLKPFDSEKSIADGKEARSRSSGSLDISSLPPEARKQLESILEKQYMSWLDQNVPMLGGRTPREVATTAAGKKQIAEMINDWENMQARAPNPQFRFDFNKLRAAVEIEPE